MFLLPLAAFLGTELSSEYFLPCFLQSFFLYGIISVSTETFSTLFFPKNKQQQYSSLAIPLLTVPTASLNSSLQQIFSFSALTAPLPHPLLVCELSEIGCVPSLDKATCH